MVFCAEVVNMTTWIGAKGAHKHVKHIFTKDFEGSRGPRGIQEDEQPAEPDIKVDAESSHGQEKGNWFGFIA